MGITGKTCRITDTWERGDGQSCHCPGFAARLSWHKTASPAFTLIELLTVIFIIGVLAAIGFIAYRNYIYKAQVVTALNEINMMEKEIIAYSNEGAYTLPANLADIGYAGFLDPWNRPYVYEPDLSIAPRTRGGVPINTDYDLYSEGRDNLSVPDIGAPISQDDIIRAGNGAYKGYAKGY